MLTIKSLSLSTLMMVIITLFIYPSLKSQASSCFRDRDNGIDFGNGKCDPGEGPAECIELDDFVLEICPPADTFKQFPISDVCNDPETDCEIPCSEWSYVLSKKGKSSAKNISFLVPVNRKILEIPKNAKVFENGTGVPGTGGFGRFDLSNNALKIPIKFEYGRRKTYISYKTTQAQPGATALLLKAIGKESGLIQGPGGNPASVIQEITKTTEIVTTKDGINLKVVTDLAGNLVNVEGFDSKGEFVPVQIIPQNQAFICTPTVADPNLEFPNPNEYDCQVVISIPDRTTTRAGENSLCDYWYRGRILQFPCN